MSPPLVSVVTSACNAAAHLPGSLDSILTQRDVDLEFIVIDDGSRDATAAILRDYAARDRRLRVVSQEHSGLTRALIRGCADARGEFIARHDADDLSFPSRLAEQVARLRSDPSLAMVSCRSRAIGPEGELLWETQQDGDADRATELLLEHWQGPLHATVTFRKSMYEAVGGYRPHFYFAQDADLWLRLAEQGRLAYVPRVLCALRVTETSTSAVHRDLQHRLGALAHDCLAARRAGRAETALLEQAARLRPDSRARESRAADGAYFIGRCLLRQRDRRARRYLRRALERQPWSVKKWIALGQAYLVGR